MSSPTKARKLTLALRSEPTVHFLALGAILFLVYHLAVGNPRIVVVTHGVKAELERHFKDANQRTPTPAELAQEIHIWEGQEALYREALRDRLDRNDSTIRALLADRIRARVALGVPRREPSQADLDAWLAARRNLYEEPRRYEYELIAFPKSEPSSARQIERYQRALQAGADPRTLGRPITGAVLDSEALRERLGSDLAARIQGLPPGSWQRLANADALLLARLVSVTGGLPAAEELRRHMLVDWQYADRQLALGRALQSIVNRYRFEERP